MEPTVGPGKIITFSPTVPRKVHAPLTVICWTCKARKNIFGCKKYLDLEKQFVFFWYWDQQLRGAFSVQKFKKNWWILFWLSLIFFPAKNLYVFFSRIFSVRFLRTITLAWYVFFWFFAWSWICLLEFVLTPKMESDYKTNTLYFYTINS